MKWLLSILLATLGISALAQPAPINRRAMVISGLAASAQTPQTIAAPKYWWVSVDATNQANVTNWVDRVQALSLTNGTAGASRPTITAANLGVHFSGASSQILTNRPGFTVNNTGADTGETICWLMNADSLGSFSDIFQDNGGNFSMGIYTASELYFYRNPNTAVGQAITASHYIDVVLVGNLTGSATNIWYTNGVPAKTNTTPTFPFSDPFIQIGMSANGKYTGYLREIVVYSNQFLTQAKITSLHQYFTNTYGYTP